MSRGSKVLLGLVTLIPLAWATYLLVRIAGFVVIVINQGGSVGHGDLPFGMELILVHIGVGLLHLIETAVFFMHALKNPRLSQDARIGWLIGLPLASMLAVPGYFWFQIWPEHATPPAQPHHIAAR